MLARRFSAVKLQSLNLLFPPLCASCHVPVQDANNVCADCWKELRFMAGPACSCCGVALPADTRGSMICAQCIRTPPEFDAARAALQYDDASRRIIHAFKYHDRQHVLPLLTRWLFAAGEPLLKTTDMIVPVPLSRLRLFGRMFNQSALLAQALSKKTGILYAPLALTRARHTPPQAGLNRAARQKNLQGAFKANAESVKGKHVLLVDDVMTTGATANACAKTLKSAGAASVRVLTIARVNIEEA